MHAKATSRRATVRRTRPRKRWRAAVTASLSLFSLRARAMWRRRRMRCPRRLLAALADWPRNGCPDNPEAWLLTVARRRVIDAARRQTTTETAADDLKILPRVWKPQQPRARRFPTGGWR